MKETAVEWLIDESMKLVVQYMKGTLNEDTLDDVIYELGTKAKEMEREQIIDFGYDIADDLACGKYRDKKAMEERYNEFLTYREDDDDI
jgi:hypothetical protein